MSFPFFKQSSSDPMSAPLDDDDTQAYRTLLARWLIDLALMFGSKPRWKMLRFLENDEFLTLTGITPLDDDDSNEEESHRHRRAQRSDRFLEVLQHRRAALVRTPLDTDLPLARNIGWLADLLGLNPDDQAVLCFAVLLNGDRLFHRAIAQQSYPTSTRMLYKLLARLTGQSPEEFDVALNPTALLPATGLVEVESGCVDLEDKIRVRRDLPNLLFASHADAEALIARFLKRSPRRTLTAANFPHLARDTAAAVGLLRAALANKIAGTNLLLYGPPGVGKTEYAAVLAEAVGAELYEVDYADEDGDPIQGEQRLRAFNLGQRLLARRDDALLLFDEVEDVFERDPFDRLFGGCGDGATAGKAWINRTLENNPVPALWCCKPSTARRRCWARSGRRPAITSRPATTCAFSTSIRISRS